MLAPDIDDLIKKTIFTPQTNTWMPKPHPKGALLNIYNNINANNLLTNGGVMTQPPGSAFATTSKGETYFKPVGSAFSYGTGANSGKTCFHYRNFADCH